jgi:hypothetical protein
VACLRRVDTSPAAAKRRGVATSPVTKSATSGGAAASTAGERGPRAAYASLRAWSMLPRGRGANIAATRGDGAVTAPLGAGFQRIRAEEALGVVRFPPCCTGAVMHRGPLALPAPTAATFSLFMLPEGWPRCFLPVADEPTAAVAD